MNLLLAAHSAVILKAENVAEKVEWMNKIGNIMGSSKVTSSKGAPESGVTPMRQSHSDGSLVSSEI